jgi:hypothetical protein
VVRIQQKCSTAFAVAAGVAILTQAAWAQSAYEGFNLTFPLFNTGSGFTGAWATGGFNAFASGYTAAEKSLVFSGLATTPGRVIAGAFPAINGATRSLAQPLGADNTTAYVSVLIRPQGTLDAGIFNGFFGVTLNGAGSQDLFVGKPGAGETHEYVLESRGGAGQVSSGVPTVAGQTVLLVVKAEFLAGNDMFTLYVNPTPGEAEPAAGTIKSDQNLGTVSKVGIYSTGAFEVDELRIGATYADVTPRMSFAGTPGAANCHGVSVSGLNQEFGSMAKAAPALGFGTVSALQGALTAYCGN